MKKIIFFGVLLLVFAACKKEKNEPDLRPDERLNELLSEYQTKLTNSPNGWIAYLFPGAGGGYTFKFKFDNKNRVISYADVNAESVTTPLESSYRLKATQLPSLYFDTYSYLHILADPDERKSGGTRGVGFQSDFEFSILSASEDTIKLKGNLFGSTMLLIRAKEGEGDDYIQRAVANTTVLRNIEKFTYYYNKLSIGSKQYQITINPDQQTVSFFYDSNGFKRFSTAYAVSPTGLVFKEPFTDDGVIISEFHDLNVDLVQKKLTFKTGSLSVTTENVSTPLVIDQEAATRMYTANYAFASDYGFTKNGVINAYNVTSIPGYLGTVYYPKYGSGYDALLFYYNNGSRVYGPAFLTSLEADGRMIFYGYAGNFGTSPGTPHTTTIANVRAQWLEAQGYYVYQNGENYYDLVSVADGRNWIRFY